MSRKMPSAPPKNRVKEVVIDADREGQRIDNYLMSALKGVPKTHVYRILRKGEVRVNKGRVKPNHRLHAGDVVRIPPIRMADSKPAPAAGGKLLERLRQRILYEDKDILLVNKPSGMAVHGGSGLSYGLIEALRVMFPHARRLELVHRLDRDTSGVLMIAKKTSILRNLHEQLRAEGMEKIYLALVKGPLPAGETWVDAPLKKNELRSGERVVRVDPQGKAARTLFLPQQVFRQASLAEVHLFTGRTHQIRVHARHIGHPLAGDDKYGDEEFNKTMRGLGLKRLFLHARTLKFLHPGSGEKMQITAPLDDDLKQILDRLQTYD